jgi:dihydroflavonol-4-reductase
MNVITGATGHVGNVLVKKLLSLNRNVRVLIENNTDDSVLNNLRVEKSTGNLLDPVSLFKAFKGAEIVYHLAGKISLIPRENDIVQKINYNGTINVIEACKKCNVKKLIYMSSVHALKEPPEGITIDERYPFDPDNNRGQYDKSKAMASVKVLQSVTKDFKALVVCPSGVIGPYDSLISFMGKTIIDFINGKIKFLIDGAYDFVDVRDVADGTVLAADKGEAGEKYILSGQRITVIEIMEILSGLSKFKIPKFKIPKWIANGASILATVYYELFKIKPVFTKYSFNTLQRNSMFSHIKASKELGYNPRLIKESILDSVIWFRKMGMISS